MISNILKVHITNSKSFKTSRFRHIIRTKKFSKINTFEKLKEFCCKYISKHDKCFLKVYSRKKELFTVSWEIKSEATKASKFLRKCCFQAFKKYCQIMFLN